MEHSTFGSSSPAVDPSRDHVLGPPDAPITPGRVRRLRVPFLRPVPTRPCRPCAAVWATRCDSCIGTSRGPEHPHARHAAEAAEAAGAQGRFWQMHDTLFEDQHALADSDLVATRPRSAWMSRASARPRAARGAALERVHADLTSAALSGAHGTPTFFINGIKHEGADTFDDLLAAVREQLPAQSDMLDAVDEASNESFPASDAPGWIGEASV